MRFQDINDYILDDIFDMVDKKERENKQYNLRFRSSKRRNQHLRITQTTFEK